MKGLNVLAAFLGGAAVVFLSVQKVIIVCMR